MGWALDAFILVFWTDPKGMEGAGKYGGGVMVVGRG